MFLECQRRNPSWSNLSRLQDENGRVTLGMIFLGKTKATPIS